VALLFGAVLATLTPAYRGNDDPLLAMIASGTGIAAAPDPRLVFTHSGLGYALNALYALAPFRPWYGLYLLGAHFVSHVALLAVLLAAVPLRRALGGYLLYFLAVGLPLLTNLQFTSTAILVSSTGMLCLLSDPPPPLGHQRWRALVLGGSLIALGSLIRFEALAFALLLALPASLAYLPALHPAERRARIVAVLSAVAVALALRTWDRAGYERQPEWREFLELNEQRVLITDWGRAPYGPETAALYERQGWSANDAALMLAWFYPDPAVFSKERMEQLAASATAIRGRFDSSRARRQLQRVFTRDPAAIGCVALVLPALVWLGPFDRRRLVAILATGAFAAALACGLALAGRAPIYVVQPALAFALGAALLGLGAGGEGPRSAAVTTLACLLALGGGALSLRRAAAESETARTGNRKLHASIATLRPSRDHLYVAWTTAFPYPFILPLESTEYLKDLRLFSLGWPQRSPVGNRMLRSFAITDLYRALLARKDLYLIAAPSRMPLLETYGRERLGVDARFAPHLETPGFVVFQGEVR
jgi:hypothetical protein